MLEILNNIKNFEEKNKFDEFLKEIRKNNLLSENELKIFINNNNINEDSKNLNDFTFVDPKYFVSPEKAINSSNDSFSQNFLKNMSSDKKNASPIVYEILQKKINFEIKEFSFSS